MGEAVMENMDIKEKILGCLENLGVFADAGENFLLNEYIKDSMTYMMFLVGLEEAFGVDIPDEYLSSVISPEQTLEGLCGALEALLEAKVL
ncbi:MAG: hypothetical protein LBK00_10475 [Treponema sp.]|jgi:acyl carrier protein|nr:hypothetical protein [Treponema sp.]